MNRTLSLLTYLVGRRTAPAAEGRPASAEELEWLLRAAATVPDHGALRPWRFAIIAGESRHQLGEALAADVATARPDAPPGVLDQVRCKALVAPTLIVLIAAPRGASKVPEWEQVASASCCGYAIVLAAHALGLGAVWKSTPLREGEHVRSLCELGADEQLLGWINVGGRSNEDLRSRRPPLELSSVTTVLTAQGWGPYRPPTTRHVVGSP